MLKTKSGWLVVIPSNLKRQPEPHERRTAIVLAEYFKSNITFIKTETVHTADIEVIKTRQIWELKSPTGNGKRTIAHQFARGSKQSKRLVIDSRRTQLSINAIVGRSKEALKDYPAIRKVLLIDKNGKVIVIL